MSSTYLVTRPEHDDTTHYLSHWCKETINIAEEKGIKIIDLAREKANKKEFESRVIKFSPELIVLNGHGDNNTVTGHKNQPVLILGENEHLLSSKIVYALSCSSAKNLGVKSIEIGAKNYTGYDNDFIFVFEPDKISRPLLDETAALFLQPSNIFISSLIKGNSVKDSLERSKNMIKKNFIKVIAGNEQDMAIAKYLWWNLRHFVSHGDYNVII